MSLWSALPLVLVLPGSAEAATWRVEASAEDRIDRIGRVAAAAASGDTILVGPGTYFEHVPLTGKSLLLRSILGPEATVLDGSLPIEGREGSILYIRSSEESERLSVEGFTLTHGSGSAYASWQVGGAIACIGWPRELRVRNCHFGGNHIPGSGGTGGGAAFVEVSDARFDDCEFTGNVIAQSGMGGDLLLMGSSVVIDSCGFYAAGQDGPRGVAIWSWADLTISGSSFVSEGGSGDPMIESLGTVVNLVRNRFVAHDGMVATRVVLAQDFAGVYSQSFRITDNLFCNDDPDRFGRQIALSFTGPELDVELTGNTFVGCGISGDYVGRPLRCYDNIFARSLVALDVPTSQVSCNCVSDTSYWRPNASLTWTDTVFHDPIFCAPDSGDFHISRASPCAEGHSPGACGTIGLYEAACDLIPVRATSWGGVKARFLAPRGRRVVVDSLRTFVPDHP